MSFDPSPALPDITGAPLTTLRIVVASLAIGINSFAAVAVGQNTGKPHFVASKFDKTGLAMLALSLGALPLGFILPRIVFAAGRNAPSLPALPGATPEQTLLATIQNRIQASTIIGCAIYEGGAFAAIVEYMRSRELAHLAVAAVLLIGILANLPSAGAYRRRIEDELRRMMEQEQARRLNG
jgi:hypothetical protein